MRCYTAKKLIDLWLDKELDESRSSALIQHLQKCPSCNAIAEKSRKINTMLSSDENPEFPSWIHNRIVDQARMHESTRKTLKRRYNLQTIPVSMAVLMSLYVGLLVGAKTFETVNTDNSSTQSTEYVVFGENSLIAMDESYGVYSE